MILISASGACSRASVLMLYMLTSGLVTVSLASCSTGSILMLGVAAAVSAVAGEETGGPGTSLTLTLDPSSMGSRKLSR